MQEIITISRLALVLLIILVGIVCIIFGGLILQKLKILIAVGAAYVILKAILYIAENSSIHY